MGETKNTCQSTLFPVSLSTAEASGEMETQILNLPKYTVRPFHSYLASPCLFKKNQVFKYLFQLLVF